MQRQIAVYLLIRLNENENTWGGQWTVGSDIDQHGIWKTFQQSS